jgi:hypothetical protein
VDGNVDEDGEKDPWLFIERSPLLEENKPEEPVDESDTRKLRVGSKGGALLDNVDEPTELVERQSENDDVDCENIVLEDCDNAGVAEWINPEDPEWDIEEEDKCPEECGRPGGCDRPETLRSLLAR